MRFANPGDAFGPPPGLFLARLPDHCKKRFRVLEWPR
jgi:hypothetical protein